MEEKEYRIIYDKYSNKLYISEYLNNKIGHFVGELNWDDLFEILKRAGVRAGKRKRYTLVENENWKMIFRKKWF